MYKNKKILALIPARGGSKGIIRKNVKLLSGKPLIAWTIAQAKRSKYVDRIFVSTEDQQIAGVSKKFGAEVPFMRPKKLATDKAKGIDVVLHAINWAQNSKEHFDLLLLLQPTSPLRTSKDIDKAIELLFAKDAQAIVSVCECDFCPAFVKTLPQNGSMKDFINPAAENKNRQDFKKHYKLNGAIYLADCGYIKKEKSFLGDKTFAYIMPKERSVDIDDGLDFMFAEFLLGNNRIGRRQKC